MHLRYTVLMKVKAGVNYCSLLVVLEPRVDVPGHIRRPNPIAKSIGSLAFSVPSSFRNLSGVKSSAFGNRASSRDIALAEPF